MMLNREITIPAFAIDNVASFLSDVYLIRILRS